jgi:protein-S-isoprenylcysteine O-methyltransferase Ste14
MSTEVAVAEAHSARFEESLAAEKAAERSLMVTIVKTIIVSLPVMIGIFLLMTAIAISEKTEWYVWVGLGVGLGVIGAILLGSLAGATMAAHRLDAVDRATYD